MLSRQQYYRFIILLLLLAPVAFASADSGLIPQGCADFGAPNCGITDFIQLGLNIYNQILQVVGSVTLLVFVYGGLIWMTSTGNAQRIEHGKKVFEGALIGLLIIFGSWVIINFAATALTGGTLGEPATLFNNPSNSGFERPVLEVPRS
ncbi:hypothetical protein COV04_02140 [Candidatus Uhrbacteria bacterium CG10_big_fil_rev_8_21_14_0_10_48_11]|uniref:Ammonium transporter AmtB-like domain-containing protein n=1 Tax=Candidatus Uhrbacteria bacterium CG10_big_fil_rev_8_21_14_0_10_48_11 TaxID=1975037 RepID=A0A2M8LEQ7_9BACT|nr:MAG: hypothetical protein COV04_02140 [Candidatus Uhrbacteria bacterium CG10_big_fil_rev_8_21_14_0_10_48_11]